MTESIARRSVQSSALNIAASGVQTVVQFVRSIVLARLLAPGDFGVYAFASAIVLTTRAVPNFGMNSAILHRTAGEDNELALRVDFTLTLIFNSFWAVLLATIGALFVEPQNRWVLWAIIASQFIDNLVQVGRVVLVKRVVFRRLALLDTIVILGGSITAIVMAWLGFGVWSLVSTDLVGALVPLLGLYVIKPVWHPHFGWSPDLAKFLLNFGKRTFSAGIIGQLLEWVDDLWTGFFLGDTALGFYSRAYTFSTYPRKVIAAPINAVAAGTYAELKQNPQQLSQAFFRVNSFLVRAGFLFAGLLALLAPEFIQLIIGPKWMPMLTTFRLMLIFTLLDPLQNTLISLFVAVGEPEKAVTARLTQLFILVSGLFILGPRFGIDGVAIVVNLMLIVGISFLFHQARRHVRFSIRRMFLVPLLALVFGILGAWLGVWLLDLHGVTWYTAVVKLLCFTAVYSSIQFLFERGEIYSALSFIRHLRP